MMELKPCPFCGGEARIINVGTLGVWCSALCVNPECGCDWGVYYPTEAEAATAWNTRHVETCKLNELDALTQTLSMADGCAWSECSACGCLTPDDARYCCECGRKVVR